MFDSAFRTLYFTNPAKLSLQNDRINIAKNDEKDEIQIPLNDIYTIILESPQITITSALLSACAKHKIAIFSCDTSHIPNGIFTSFGGHYRAFGMLKKQINQTNQQKAIVWQKIIQCKIHNQSEILKTINNKNFDKLCNIKKLVKLNDSTNCEAQAAAIYFPSLFGEKFTRNDLCAVNAALNYGYAIIRGVFARAIVSFGLNPALGIFHKNELNPFNLADDLMEPYRIFVDKMILNLNIKDEELTKENKAKIIEILNDKIELDFKNYPLNRAIIQSTQSYVQILIESSINSLSLPWLKI